MQCHKYVYTSCTNPCSYSSSDHTDYVRGVTWHPHKPHILTCGWDGQLLLHNAGPQEKDTGSYTMTLICSYTHIVLNHS